MENETITFANSFGEMIAPVLLAIRATGFFEAYVFMPVMTIASVFLFMRLRRQYFSNGTFSASTARLQRCAFSFGYYSLCFLVLNAFAVALKTFIMQEMDYVEWHWYIPYVAPLHVYIVSVAAAHLYLIWKNQSTVISKLLSVYIQIGLLGGYYIATYRIFFEPFEWTDVTTGFSGFFMCAWFSILNWDVALRFFRPLDKESGDAAEIGASDVSG